jgi:hypothetical protein
MERLPDAANVQFLAVSVAGELCGWDSQCADAVLVPGGPGVGLVTRALAAHPSHRNLQAAVCLFVVRVADTSPCLRTVLLEALGPCVRTALTAHPADVDVVVSEHRWCC